MRGTANQYKHVLSPLLSMGIILCGYNEPIFKISEHKSHTKLGQKPARHTVATLKYIAIEVLKGPQRGGNFSNLPKRVKYWIYTLGTLVAGSIIEEFDVHPFL